MSPPPRARAAWPGAGGLAVGGPARRRESRVPPHRDPGPTDRPSAELWMETRTTVTRLEFWPDFGVRAEVQR